MGKSTFQLCLLDGNWYTSLSYINSAIETVTLLQGHTGTVRYSLLTIQPHLSTSALITFISFKEETQTFLYKHGKNAQQHAYILTTALTAESVVILLLQKLNIVFPFPLSMHQSFKGYL